MPELPEVETVCTGLKNKILNLKVKKIKIINDKLRRKIPAKIEKIFKEKSVKCILRRGKNGIIVFNCNYVIEFHLGMTGKFMISNNLLQLEKHDHLLIEFYKNCFITYNDVRKFGYIDIKEKPIDLVNMNKLGYEPESIDIFSKYIIKKITKSTKTIKSLLLDQSIIVGIGNIYASEILFNAGVNPKKTGNRIKKKHINKILNSTNYILRKAIKEGGSSIKNYNNVEGDLGYFQNSLNVYDKEGLSCLNCKNLILKIKQSGRSTFFCSFCQR
ncbi:MAG: DNA-formamidopyrimidine glycosylase [Rickettsiales bacterium]|nr:DNA-formamidopyrimidine glycosylase [Rickettsiales bacterium]